MRAGFNSKGVFTNVRLAYKTSLGQLYEADCIDFLRAIPSESMDTFFADPPFNLNKRYGKKGSDSLSEQEYLEWSQSWLQEAVRVLAPGGALFVYNLPKWLIHYGAFLNGKSDLTFKHWIAIDKAHSLPIPSRLSPSHYGMLYYIKGTKPRFFDRDAVRIPVAVCRHCKRDIKDYGGHKKYLNPKGLNLSDVWDDIPPVRHRKYKYRAPNELAPQILERVILLTTRPDGIVCDPFVGGGTTAYVAERLGRQWRCADLNTVSAAVRRLSDLENGIHPVWKSSTGRSMPPRNGGPGDLPLFR